MMTRRVGEHAVEILPAEAYRSPLWHEARRGTVSASEISAVLGLSPYSSPFDLWWSKRLGDSKSDNRAMSRGRRVEPLILEDFQDEHPHLLLRSFGLVQNIARPWQVFTPDALAYEAGRIDPSEHDPVAVVEAKTDGGSDEWGERGTDEVPVHYRAQAIYQMDVVGVDLAYVPMWRGFDYRLYQVPYDAEDAAFMRDEARRFLDSLEADEEPPIDSHVATTERLKRLHPSVIDEPVDVPAVVVRQYLAAKRLKDTATDRVALAENRLRHVLGAHKTGEVDGVKVCSRSVYDVKASLRKYPAYTVSRLNVKEPKTTPATTIKRKESA
jgi:putative phage-type endonuclease